MTAPAIIVPPRRVLWTGGFDSTALVLETLRTERGRVEPYAIEFTYPNMEWQKARREADARDRIRAALPPGMAARLEPDQVIPFFPEHADRAAAVFDAIWSMRTAAGLSGWHSPQVSGLVVVAEHVAGLAAGYVAGDSALEDPFTRRELVRRLALPFAHVSKRALLEQAHRAGYADVLDLTWSCEGDDWDAVDGPCGNCLPCRSRIIPAIARTK